MIQERPPGRIFLSYRRTDTPHISGRLFDRLEARFGQGNVFIDVDSIEPGLDYGDVISTAVGSCDVLLALIGSRWIDAVDDNGRRRLGDPDDLVVLEIATALERQVRVIPILVDGAAPPRRDDLPELVAPLARRQAVHLDHATFTADVTHLVTVVERALTTARAEPGPQVRRSWREWTIDDFTLLLHDRRPSAQRIASVLDVLAEQPDVERSLSDLAAATGLSHGELRGAFAGLTYLCNHLRSDVRYEWPILWSSGSSERPGQNQETRYHVPSTVANHWKQARHH